MPRKTPMDWAYEHAGKLQTMRERINETKIKLKIKEFIDGWTIDDYAPGYWTILKNISLAYCIEPFGLILNRKKIVNTIYFDPFCGAGITPLKGNNASGVDWVPGSPIISAFMTKYPFKKYYFSDINRRATGLASEIITELNSGTRKINYEITDGLDANDAITEIIPKINDQYIFAYLDPTGFQLDWISLEKLLKLKMFDIIMNYQTRMVERIPPSKVDSFFGPCAERIPHLADCDQKLDCYMAQIQNLGYTVTKIRIGMNRTDQYYYHLLHISPLNSYQQILANLKSRVETFNGDSIKNVWDDLSKGSKQLSLPYE